MRILALDFGERRIGVAATDPLGLMAQPLTVIERESLAQDIAKIGEIVRRRGAERIVLGLPLNMNGTEGPPAKRAKRFAARLKRELGLEIELWDERLTTVEAEQVLLAADRSRAERRRRKDEVAAAVILEDYLAAKRRSGA